MWFRNLYLFKLENSFNLSADDLDNALKDYQLSDCAPGQRESIGWLSPFGRENELLVLASQGTYLIHLGRQERLLPASVIKDHLEERIDQIQVGQGRKVGGKERREIKEELEFELLPKAFTKTTHTDGWIDSNKGWIVINTNTASKAESFAKFLRSSVGSLSISLPDTESSLMATMTNWLKLNQLPRPFEFGQECLFKSMDNEMSTVAFKKHELISDELSINLEAGKLVSQIELIWQQRIKFILTEELIIKRVKFLDIMTDDFDKQGFESAADKLDAEFALMVGEVRHFLDDLSESLKIIS